MSKNTAAFSELTQKLLNKLSQACNKDSGVEPVELKITLGRFSWYHKAPTAERLKAHEELELLESRCNKAFSIIYTNQGFDAVPILGSIKVINGFEFLQFIDVTPKIHLLESYIKRAKKLISTAPGWLMDELIELPNVWAKGYRYKEISPKQIDKLELAIKVIVWIEESRVDACDYRTVSVQALGSSKALEKNTHWIAKILSLKDPERLAGLSSSEVLEFFGLSKLGSELKVRGKCLIHYSEGNMPIQFAKPYVSLEMTNIDSITLEENPRYVLFIENLTTFRRYSQEINDDSLVVYTGGFPSIAWVDLIKPLVASLGSDIPVFHWGDIDVGGYRILAFLTQALRLDIIPYCMSNVETSVTGDALNVVDLQKALGKNLSGQLLQLNNYLKSLSESGEELRAVEQESIVIRSPLSELLQVN